MKLKLIYIIFKLFIHRTRFGTFFFVPSTLHKLFFKYREKFDEFKMHENWYLHTSRIDEYKYFPLEK